MSGRGDLRHASVCLYEEESYENQDQRTADRARRRFAGGLRWWRRFIVTAAVVEPAAPVHDPAAPAPAAVRCSGPAGSGARGHGLRLPAAKPVPPPPPRGRSASL